MSTPSTIMYDFSSHVWAPSHTVNRIGMDTKSPTEQDERTCAIVASWFVTWRATLAHYFHWPTCRAVHTDRRHFYRQARTTCDYAKNRTATQLKINRKTFCSLWTFCTLRQLPGHSRTFVPWHNRRWTKRWSPPSCTVTQLKVKIEPRPSKLSKYNHVQ